MKVGETPYEKFNRTLHIAISFRVKENCVFQNYFENQLYFTTGTGTGSNESTNFCFLRVFYYVVSRVSTLEFERLSQCLPG